MHIILENIRSFTQRQEIPLRPLTLLVGYFYVWTFHRKAARIARRTRQVLAYPLCMAVMWVVLASNLLGYLVGSWQRWRDHDRYQKPLDAYLAAS